MVSEQVVTRPVEIEPLVRDKTYVSVDDRGVFSGLGVELTPGWGWVLIKADDAAVRPARKAASTIAAVFTLVKS